MSTRTSRVATLVAFIGSIVLIAGASWLFFNRQYIQDWIVVQGYAPSAEITLINQRTQLTDKGRFVFYATRPTIEGKDAFNKACPRQETGSPILGCYTTSDRIFIYNLTNKQLDGMEEVTAVHEMLHAIWARTSDADREKLTTELKSAYDTLNDPALKKRMEYYERTEPGEFVNELHSILGTEVASLGRTLESYYSQFFNRATVLALHTQYQSLYNSLYSRADSLFASMQTLSDSIQTRSKTYDATVAQVSADIGSFNARAKSGGFSSQAQFNAERSALIRRTQALEAERQSLNADIVTYNGYYTEYQTIAKQIDGLNDTIDSFKEIEQSPSV